MQHGGALLVQDNSNVSLTGTTTVTFYNNMAESGGGVLYTYGHCNITIERFSKVSFVKNIAMQCGGAMCCESYSRAAFEGFKSNYANRGGAICVVQSVLTFTSTSVVILSNNRAAGDGGAIHFSGQYTAMFDHDSSISLLYNFANRYGGAFYGKVNHTSKRILNSTRIKFTNNKALFGDSAYLDIPTSCNEECLNTSIVGVTKETLKHSPLANYIYTPPRKLVLGDPAVCTDDDNVTTCGMYYINNIMLGQEITINACVLDYYDQPAGETQFKVDSNDEDHYINGSNSVLIACDGLRGISVEGSDVSDVTNFDINLTSHTGSKSDSKTISISLITELSPCHPGFYYYEKRCVCYHDNDIIRNLFW